MIGPTLRPAASGALRVIAMIGAVAYGPAPAMPAIAKATARDGSNAPIPDFTTAGTYPPGPCAGLHYYAPGYCGYPIYTGPALIRGHWTHGLHFYRWQGGPLFWDHGAWHSWRGWRRARWNWLHTGGWPTGWRSGERRGNW